MRSLQEKFQVTSKKTKIENGKPWTSFESARKDQSEVGDWCPEKAVDMDSRRFNEMPPNMDVSDQCVVDINQMPLVMSGETDASHDTNATAFSEGFRKRQMSGSDDQYTGEHVDEFYGDAGGFVERNNYLDRM